jgi:hypothetical protein
MLTIASSQRDADKSSCSMLIGPLGLVEKNSLIMGVNNELGGVI